jgi:hypothetical protein
VPATMASTITGALIVPRSARSVLTLGGKGPTVAPAEAMTLLSVFGGGAFGTPRRRAGGVEMLLAGETPRCNFDGARESDPLSRTTVSTVG